MSSKLANLISRSCGLVLVACGLLHAAPVSAGYSAPGKVTAIEQASSAVFNGNTFVRIAGAACPGRPDGYFVVPNNTKQALQLDILLNSLRQGVRVTMAHDASTCQVTTVGTCANATPC